MLPIRFLPHAVLLAGLGTWINQIDSTNPAGGVSLFEESSGSATDREFVATKDVAPTLPIVTSDLTALSVVGFNGVPIGSALTVTSLAAYARELPLEALPAPIATSAHIKLAIANGYIIPTSVTASHNQVAKLSLMVHAITDGTTAPFVYTDSTTISSGAGGTSNIYTCGPVKFTTAGLCQGIVDINVDFGIQILKESDSGEVYPTHVSIISRMSRIEFTTKDPELAATVGDGLSVTSFVAYFRNVAANGQRVADATATHCSVTGTAGMVIPGSLTLAHKRPGQATFTYVPALNTNLVTISTAATIPTS